MKKVIVAVAAVAFFTACNGDKTDSTTVTTDTSVASMNSMADTMVVPADHTTTVSTVAYVPAEGDVTYRNGKVMVYKNNDYVVVDNDVTLDDGIVVRRNGEVVRDGKIVRLEEGESVSRVGRWFNKAGEGMEDAWDGVKKGATKAAEGVKKGATKAAEGVKKAGQKVGEEVKEAVH